MRRLNFLKALAGLGVALAAPKLKDEEENHVITSEDGRTAWDGEGNQVWSWRDDLWTSQYMNDPLKYYEFKAAPNIMTWTPKS